MPTHSVSDALVKAMAEAVIFSKKMLYEAGHDSRYYHSVKERIERVEKLLAEFGYGSDG